MATDPSSAVVSIIVVAFVALTLLSLLFVPALARVYTTRLSGGSAARQRDVIRSLLLLLIPQVFFYGCVAVGTALLHARRRFAAPAFSPVLANLARIGLFLLVGSVVGSRPTLDRLTGDHGLRLLLGAGTTATVAVMVWRCATKWSASAPGSPAASGSSGW